MLTQRQLRFLDTIDKDDLQRYLRTTKTAGVIDDLKANWEYGKYLAKHKYHVMQAGSKLDLGQSQLLIHDIDKLAPKSWSISRDWVHSPEGMKGTRALAPAYKTVRKEHWKKTPYGHHWYAAGTPIEKVPIDYRLEALADWYAVYAANLSPDATLLSLEDWYMLNRHHLPLDPVARAVADDKLLREKFASDFIDDRKEDWEYLKYLLKHKYHVFKDARELGVPFWQAASHDTDKLFPDKFRSYSEWFMGNEGRNGSRNPEVYKEWRKDVEDHYKTDTSHHWRKLGLKPEQVPLNNELEAMADWASFSKPMPLKRWYTQNRATLPVEESTKLYVDEKLNVN